MLRNLLPNAVKRHTRRSIEVSKIPFEVGDSVQCSKTVSESDVYLFAGITGDMNKIHLNEQFMKTQALGTRIVHGALTFSIGGAAQTEFLNRHDPKMMCVSLGYDKVRFLKPVFFGDTLTTTYTIIEIDDEKLQTRAKQETINQNGDLVCVSEHMWQFLMTDPTC
jgi:acyl dehydratase